MRNLWAVNLLGHLNGQTEECSKGNSPTSVRKSKTRTAGVSNGKIKANADAKMTAIKQQLIAYDGSYVRGYTAEAS